GRAGPVRAGRSARRGPHPGPALRRHRQAEDPTLRVSLFDKFQGLAELKQALAEGRSVPSVATPMDQIHSATSGIIEGRRVVLAGTNNYLGLTFDARCRKAAIEAIETLGTGTTGSRMDSGNYAGHRDLESALAGAFGWPSGIV